MPQFWLMKSEPHCFSFDDLLRAPDRTSPWDGVRNYQARNFLRDEVRVGDGVLFYHSNVPDPAIVGVARVVRPGYPDDTALNPESDHFDPRSSVANPIWYMVDVQALQSFSCPVTRQVMKDHPRLSDLGVLKRGNRLSVLPVEKRHWSVLLELGGLSPAVIERFLQSSGENNDSTR
ncbi:EVE domain-containing protein [Trichloromonas sp.]|uniref:EVE domain-containing protein n=1 Tax=Trichloromonas sp. TaxID=3069249 RepID=UPI002A3C0E0B|nr:EVE domain-containing protein [Trichloromonas sp.]